MVMVLMGASHQDVALDEINSLSGAGHGLARRLLNASDGIVGAVVLSTCNRFEVYLDLEGFHDAIEVTTETVAELTGLDIEHVSESMRVVVGDSVAQHLFSVASGLESMVVGEDEIAGQVRAALSTAQTEGTTTPQLERLMQRALATSKAVTSSTGLGAAGRSIVTVALDLLEERYGAVGDRRALVLGTGSYARVVIAALRRRDCGRIQVFSASGRAEQFALSHQVEAVNRGELIEALAQTDFVIACSGTQRALVDADLVQRSRPVDTILPFIDLALSPDIDSAARDLPLIDVIDLDVIQQAAPQEHSAAILKAQEIVLAAVEDFEAAEVGRTADHAVVAMRAHVMGIINEELERMRSRVDDQTAEEVARSLNRVSSAILHTPSVRAQELARTGNLADYRKAIQTLFGIDIDVSLRD